MPNNDRAILVGIAKYADPAFPALNGPLNDVELMQSWLVSPAGGGLDPANVHVIQSEDPLPSVPPLIVPPNSTTFLGKFCELMFNGNKVVPRADARLYLYFSGHGFSQFDDQGPRAALYTSNASRIVSDNIPGTWYAFWTKQAAAFREIVLIMDCCRDAEFNKSEAVPPLAPMGDGQAAKNVTVFGIYAAPKGGKAQERPIAARGGKMHGLLTHALIDALDRAPANAKGEVTSDDLCNKIINGWSDICGDRPAERPEFLMPSLGPIAIFKRATVSQRFRVANWVPGDEVELLRGDMEPLATLLPVNGGAAVRVDWVDRPSARVPVTDGVISLDVPGGFCLLRKGAATKPFEAGGDDVDF